MVDTTPKKRTSSFLTSPEGKKILIYLFLLILVLAMILYAYFSQASASANWQDVFQNVSVNRQNLVQSKPYQQLLRDLRNIEATQYERIRKKEESFQPDADELRKGMKKQRGRMISFQGLLTRSIPIELPLSGSTVTVYDLRIRNDKDNLTFRVHLVRPPGSSLKSGSFVQGTGVYMMTASSDKDRSSPGPNPENSVYLMARSVEVLHTQQPPDQQDDRKTDEDATTTNSTDETDQNQDSSTASVEPPENYTNRDPVTAYWHKLLADIGPQSNLSFSDLLFKRMVQEISRVDADRLDEWVQSDLSPNQLKPINDSSKHRGKVISFTGKYIDQYTRELLGGPQDQEVVWEYWIRDQKNHLTYTLYTLEKANFEMSRGSTVKGTGVYLNTQIYDLLNPQADQKKGRQVVVLGPKLSPSFSPSESRQSAPIRWFEYLLGGLIIFFFGLFLVMVYISLRRDPDGPDDYVNDLRRRKLDTTDSDLNSEESPSPDST